VRQILVLLVLASGTAALAGCGSSSGETTSAGSSGGGGKQVAVSAQEFSFDPGTIQIDQPGTYTFTLTNDGSLQHALEIEGQGVEEETDTVAPGSTGQVTITFSKTGKYEFYCPVDGHRGQGMEGTLTLGAAAGGGGGGTGTSMENEGGGSTDTGQGGGYGYG
jgi:VCBS repeat-containing protein